MSEFITTMDQLIGMFSDTIEIVEHGGYGDENDFWQEDQGWVEESAEEYKALVEDVITDETQEQGGLSDDAEIAAWLKDQAGEEGSLVRYQGKKWVIIETNDFYNQDTFVRRVIGMRSYDG